MNFPIWLLVAVLLGATQADQSVNGSQVSEDTKPKQKREQPDASSPVPLPVTPAPPSQTAQQPHQHGQRYVIKEVIMYLTPSQIKALHTGRGVIQLQNQHLHFVQKQNTLQEEGQLLQQEIDKIEANRKSRLQQQEAVLKSLSDNEREQSKIQQHSPNIESHPQPNVQLLNQGQHSELLPLLQHTQQPQHQYLNQQNKLDQRYFLLLPQIKPVGNENLQLFYPNTEANQQSSYFPQNYPLQHLHLDDFKLVPYEYGPENELEAKRILIANLESQLEAFRVNGHQLHAQQVENIPEKELHAQRIETQLTAQHYLQENTPQLEAIQLEMEARNQAHKLEAETKAQKLNSVHIETHVSTSHQETQASDPVHFFEDAQSQHQKQVHRFDEAEPLPQALALVGGFQNHNPHQEIAHSSVNKHFNLEELPTLQEFRMKEIEEAHKLKQKIEHDEKEAEKLDAQLEAEEMKVQDLKEEQHRLQFVREYDSKNTRIPEEFHLILNPLMQSHNILEILKEPQDFKAPKLEKGFKPIKYSPKDNQEKYAREIQKIMLENHVENALAQAAAIANEPPVLVKQEIINHVKIPIPAPYVVRVPEPFEVKVPQPYPVPMEIIRKIPYPVVKVEKVEVEKPVPVTVEKRVPFTVEKKVYVKVEKPYIVKRIVKVPVTKEVPVEIPVRNTNQKLSIIKHVWDD